HLVVVGPGQSDQKGLVGRVLKGFLAEKIKGDEFETPAFRKARVYAQQSDITPEGLNGFLLRLKAALRKGAASATMNGVVGGYLAGEETPGGARQYLLSAASRLPGRLEESSFESDRIRAVLSDFPGAKLLLLDVRRDPTSPPSPDRDDYPRIGFYRYVWLGKK